MEQIERANRESVHRMLAADPILVDVIPAAKAIPALRENMILHAGPPIEWDRMCGPTLMMSRFLVIEKVNRSVGNEIAKPTAA